MENRLLWSHHHEPGDGVQLTVHRTDFGRTYGLGGYEWPEYIAEVGGLVWVLDGVMTVHVGERRWLLTPHHAVWLPAGCLGDVVANVCSRAMYVECSAVVPWPFATRVRVGVQAAALLHELSVTTDERLAGSLWQRLVPELRPVHDTGFRLPLPTDPRARDLAFALMDQAGDHRFSDHQTLADWADDLYTSAKTLQRLFLRETGMPFPRWRTQVRLNASLPRLAQGVPVQQVAREVGYRSSVGYIDAFKTHFQVTPGTYFM